MILFTHGGRLTDRHKHKKINASKYIQSLFAAYEEGQPHTNIKTPSTDSKKD